MPHPPSKRAARAKARAAAPAAVAVAAALCAVFAAAPAAAQDRADIDRTQIIGNKELPKVLYIVPWKKPIPRETEARPLASVVDEALAPVDRDVFRRQLRYDQAGAAAAPAAAPAPAR